MKLYENATKILKKGVGLFYDQTKAVKTENNNQLGICKFTNLDSKFKLKFKLFPFEFIISF